MIFVMFVGNSKLKIYISQKDNKIMNKWLVIVVLVVIVVGVVVWISSRDEPGLSPDAVKKTTRTTTSPARPVTKQTTQVMGVVPIAPNRDALRVFGVPA